MLNTPELIEAAANDVFRACAIAREMQDDCVAVLLEMGCGQAATYIAESLIAMHSDNEPS